MRQKEMLLFEKLAELNRRPEPFGEYTASSLWADPYTSERMLAFHLNETVDAASRNPGFLDRSVAWMLSHFGLAPGASVADFGCGPGLYAQRLASAGLKVTGVDFSGNSIKYARDTAAREGLEIEYIQKNYLEYESEERFDLVMMIMCDFCALSPAQRAIMLRKFHSMLSVGGRILFDAYLPGMFAGREEGASYSQNLMEGFWSPNEYFGFLNTFKYEEELVVLDKYTIVEKAHTRQIFNWLQCFTPQDIERECADFGLQLVKTWGDVAGAEYDPKASEFAIVLKVAEE